MTVVVADSTSAVPLSTYALLQTSISGWMNRSDLTNMLPEFIALTEAAISRDLRVRKQITSTTLTTVADTRYVALPSDWLEFENVSLLTTPERQLSYATLEHLDTVYPNNGGSGIPQYFTIEGDNLLFGPTPDAAYSVSVYYYARFAALATYSTNWLLTNHPGVYLHRALYHACLYVKDRTAAQDFLALYKQEVADLNAEDDDAQHSGSVLRVRQG